MKKYVTLILVLGLCSVASASYMGEVGFNLTPEGTHGLTPEDPLEISEWVYLDIDAGVAAGSTATYLWLQSTGALRLTIDGPAEFQYAVNEYGSNKAKPLLADITTLGLTRITDFEYRAAQSAPPFDPEYTGWHGMDVIDDQTLDIGGGYKFPDAAMITAPGTLTVFDHIGIHCTGPGDVVVTLTVGTNTAHMYGVPIIKTYDNAVMGDLDEDLAGVGSSITIYQIPEPMTMALLGIGGLAFIRRRR